MTRERPQPGGGDRIGTKDEESLKLLAALRQKRLEKWAAEGPPEDYWLRDADPVGLEPPEEVEAESEEPRGVTDDPPPEPPESVVAGGSGEAKGKTKGRGKKAKGGGKVVAAGLTWPAMTDAGNGERLVQFAVGKRPMRFVQGWACFVLYDAKRGLWVRDAGDVAMSRLAIDSARMFFRSARRGSTAAMRSAIASWAVRSEDSRRISAAIRTARSVDGVTIDTGLFDANSWILQCKNGVVDLKTGKLKPHSPNYLSTRRADVVFDSKAKCPLWMKFLRRVMGDDPSLMEYLQRLIGYSLTGDVREHTVIFFHGLGGNGKSTFLSVISTLFGDYACPAPRKLLMRRKSDQHPTELASLHGRRFVLCSEVEQGQEFDDALLKDLTGGERVPCRRIGEDWWSYIPTHKLFIAGNHKPIIRGDDHGIWRRMRLIPWTIRIPEKEKDRGLEKKLLAELPGILRWAVEGCLAWQRGGLDTPKRVQDATEDYRVESDTLGEFFHYMLTFDPNGSVSREKLRAVYEDFCQMSGGYLPIGPRRIADRLREHGVTDAQVRVQGRPYPIRGWLGVRIATPVEQAKAAAWGVSKAKNVTTRAK